MTPTTASGPDPSAPSSPAPITRPATPPLLGPWLLLALGVLAAVVAVTTDHVRLGGYLLAGSLGAVVAGMRRQQHREAPGERVVERQLLRGADVVVQDEQRRAAAGGT